MSGTGRFELQQAMYQRLTGDATLMALITGVYDFVPTGAGYPYLTLGEGEAQELSAAAVRGAKYTLALRVYSREGGRKQAAAIMERVHTLLHRAALTLTGYTLIFLRFESSEVRLQADGLTYQGILRFRALVQEQQL